MKRPTKPQKEAARLINDLDVLLSTVRAQWLDAKDDETRAAHREQLDIYLDERVEAMKVRDKT